MHIETEREEGHSRPALASDRHNERTKHSKKKLPY